jgi:negative regulator of replication initiation
MVWGGVQENLKTIARQDPYTQLTYELLKGRPTVYLQSDGSTVLDYGNGYKRVIQKYEAS